MNNPLDPQDLLYTNQFLSDNILNENEINSEIKHYDRFQQYIDNNNNATENYLKNNEHENDSLNIIKTLNNEWPSNNHKNRHPTFNSGINDIIKDRYKKKKITNIVIDSRNRNLANNLYPNNYTLPMNRSFYNIEKIVLKDAIIKNFFTSINVYNNNLRWQYPDKNILISDNSDKKIIPSINKNNNGISYTSIMFKKKSNFDINLLQNSVNFIPKNITVEDFNYNFRNNTSQILHKYDEPFAQEINSKNNNSIYGSPTLFYVDINPDNSISRIINRMEELNVIAIQTFNQINNSSYIKNDPFYNFIDGTSNIDFESDKFYIILEDNIITHNFGFDTSDNGNLGFPLIFTNLPSIGGISGDLINFTPFFNEIIYKKYLIENKDIINLNLNFYSNYSFKDRLNIGGIKFIRLGFKLCIGNIHENNLDYNILDNLKKEYLHPITPSFPETIILNESLRSYFFNLDLSGQTNKNYYFFLNSEESIQKNNLKLPVVGRSLLFRFLFKNYNNNINFNNTENNCNIKNVKSILNLLSWPIGDDNENIASISNKPPFHFVHSNSNSIEISNLNLLNIDIQIFNDPNFWNKINFPAKRLNIENFNNKYYFNTEDYIFLSINFNSNYQELFIPIDNKLQQVNNYYENIFLELDSNSTKHDNIYFKRDLSNIIAKINLNSIPNNRNEFKLEQSIVFYNSPLETIDSINVKILSYNGELSHIGLDSSFTLEIHEIIDILKETLIDSKRGDIITTGKYE